MKSSDAIIIGVGVIGLSLAWKLQKSGLHVQLIDRGEAAREASHAAAGMIAVCDPHNDPLVQPLAEASAALYPEFVHELEDESQMKVDLRAKGVITFLDPTSYSTLHPNSRPLDPTEIAELEPALIPHENAYYLPERWVDPRLLCAALLHSVKHRGADIASGSPVLAMQQNEVGGFSVKTEHTTYIAKVVVN